ncbi:MAG: chaperonin GroEL, partial [Clostridia bacterium]|nr:chaperonin GroEL [Clostridia bacterium]
DLESEVILNKLKKSSDINFGYDALNNKYCNMINCGIIDPTKVTISALTNAVSVVSTMLTTQGIIADKL